MLRRRFVYQGLMGGNRKWLILGGAAWALQLARRVFSTTEVHPVYVEDLEPGEKLIITHFQGPQKRRR